MAKAKSVLSTPWTTSSKIDFKKRIEKINGQESFAAEDLSFEQSDEDFARNSLSLVRLAFAIVQRDDKAVKEWMISSPVTLSLVLKMGQLPDEFEALSSVVKEALRRSNIIFKRVGLLDEIAKLSERTKKRSASVAA